LEPIRAHRRTGMMIRAHRALVTVNRGAGRAHLPPLARTGARAMLAVVGRGHVAAPCRTAATAAGASSTSAGAPGGAEAGAKAPNDGAPAGEAPPGAEGDAGAYGEQAMDEPFVARLSRCQSRSRVARAGGGADWWCPCVGRYRPRTSLHSLRIVPLRHPHPPYQPPVAAGVWGTIKFSLGAGIVAIVLYAGYTIVVTLLPAGTGSNAIMRRATEMLRSDPEVGGRAATSGLFMRCHALPPPRPQVASHFGALKTFGEGGGEGRRFYVPDHTYTDELTDAKYHRVRFNMEGERGQKAIVFAEVREGTYNFRYLIALSPDFSYVWTVVDNRPADRTIEERQADVTTLLQDGRVTFYADGETEIHDQAAVLGSYWLKVPVVRCDLDATRCESDGVTARPAWRMKRDKMSLVSRVTNTATTLWAQMTTPAGEAPALPPSTLSAYRISRGTKTLAELEAMTKSLRRKRDADSSQDGILARVKRLLGMA